MTAPSLVPLALACLVLAATAAGLDLHQVETQTLVIYTTPALRDFIEKAAIPAFTAETGIRATPVYMTAAEEYYRIRMSEERPEADVLVHASPLFLEKGYIEGVVEPVDLGVDLGSGNQSRPVPGGRIWHAFGWSPLVTVHRPGDTGLDLAEGTSPFGFPHPLLSNNGIYAVLFFEETDPAAGARILARTEIQPVNARANIGGVADGDYDLTLGYEGVARFYQERGAEIEASIPVLDGRNLTTPVLFSAALVKNNPHAGAEQFMRILLSERVQDQVADFHFRPVDPEANALEGALDLSTADLLRYDWEEWDLLEDKLSGYEVD